jgi:hypothetical protein
MALSTVVHMVSFLGWLCLLPAVLPDTSSMFLVSLTSWDLHCIFDFAHTASHISLKGAACRESKCVTSCLAMQAFLLFLGGCLHNLITLTFFMPENPAPCGPRSSANSSSSWLCWTKTAVASKLPCWLSPVKGILRKQLRYSCVCLKLHQQSFLTAILWHSGLQTFTNLVGVSPIKLTIKINYHRSVLDLLMSY